MICKSVVQPEDFPEHRIDRFLIPRAQGTNGPFQQETLKITELRHSDNRWMQQTP